MMLRDISLGGCLVFRLGDVISTTGDVICVGGGEKQAGSITAECGNATAKGKTLRKLGARDKWI